MGPKTTRFSIFQNFAQKFGRPNERSSLSTYYKPNMRFFQVVDIGFFNQRKTTQDNYDTDAMAKEFLMQFTKQCFTVGQPIVFQVWPLTQFSSVSFL